MRRLKLGLEKHTAICDGLQRGRAFVGEAKAYEELTKNKPGAFLEWGRLHGECVSGVMRVERSANTQLQVWTLKVWKIIQNSQAGGKEVIYGCGKRGHADGGHADGWRQGATKEDHLFWCPCEGDVQKVDEEEGLNLCCDCFMEYLFRMNNESRHKTTNAHSK